MKFFTTLSTLLMILIVSAGIAAGQDLVRHQQPAIAERDSTVLLEFEVDNLSQNQVLEALLFMRTSDRNTYSQIESRFEAGRVQFDFVISDPDITGFEYYLELRLVDGRRVVFPAVHDDSQPLQVDVVTPETEVLPVAEFIDYTILSPLPGRGIESEDLLIAIALFYDDQDVEEGVFGLNINGRNVTAQSEISPYIIKYAPREPLAGLQQHVQVTFEKDDRLYEVASWDFTILSGQPIAFDDGFEFAPGSARRPPAGTMELSARNQEISGFRNDALTGRLRLSGQEGQLRYSLGGYITSQETSRLQPQSRYNLDLQYGEWLQVEAGDIYPYMSDMTIAGRRVRGLRTGISLFNENLEAQIVRGQMSRSISNLYQPLEVEEVTISGQVVDTLYTLPFESGGRGTYRQNITGGRLAIGHRNRIQVAFQGMKIEDDTTSINLIRDYNDLLLFDESLIAGLNIDQRQHLLQNPHQIQIHGSNPRPRGNFVLGGELNMAFDEQRIRFSSESGMSLLNNDISGGPLNQRRAEELGVDLDADVESLFDRFSWLIIVNEQMSTLPFRFSENDAGDLEVRPFFPSAILASDSRLNLNYFDHQLQVRYQWIGPDYQSLANSTIRRDVAGFGITDRFRMLDNRFYITLGYENLRDNLLNSRDATLRTTTLRGNVSWYPLDPGLPRVSVSTLYRKRDNDLERFNPYFQEAETDIQYAALRNFQISNGDTVVTSLPRLRETLSVNSAISQNFDVFDINHQLSLSYGITKTDDRLFTYGDSESQNFSLRLRSRLDQTFVPMQARLGYNITNSESVGGLSDVRINGVNFGLETFLLENRLSVNTDLIYTQNRFSSLPLEVSDNNNPDSTSDNYYTPADDTERSRRHTNSFIVRLGAQYDFTINHGLIATVNYTNNKDPLGNLATLANDRILQLRYLFRF